MPQSSAARQIYNKASKSNLIPGEAAIISKKAQISTRNDKAKDLANDMRKRKVLDKY